jgi:NAD(P)H-dependent FMN reductase
MKLAVVVGATRQGRKTINQALWAVNTANTVEGVEAEIVDLKDYPMPFFDEAISPRYNPNRTIDPAVKKWLDKIGQYDAYIFVTPEYNHSIAAVLKNALDYLTWELKRKPAAVISHGSAGGARAGVSLREILSEGQAVIVPSSNALSISKMSEIIDEEGKLDEEVKANPYGPQPALEALIADLKWCSDAFSAAKSQ